jgi:hypothetical protein
MVFRMKSQNIGRKKAAAGKTGCGQGNYAITGNKRLN